MRHTTTTTTDVEQPVLPLVAFMPTTGPDRPSISTRVAGALAELGLRPVPAAVEPVHRLLQRTGHHDIPLTTVRWLLQGLHTTRHPGRRRR